MVSGRRQREGAVEADVRADVDESHVSSELRAEERDLAALVNAECQCTGDHRIVRIEPDDRLADSHALR
jgi:hypothetical protein